MLHKAWNSKGEVPYCFPRSSIKFQGHTGQNITEFDPNWAFPDYRSVAAFKSLRFALLFSYHDFIQYDFSFLNVLLLPSLVHIQSAVNNIVQYNGLLQQDIKFRTWQIKVWTGTMNRLSKTNNNKPILVTWVRYSQLGQYIPRIIHTIHALYVGTARFYPYPSVFFFFFISFSVTSLAPSASETTLRNTGKCITSAIKNRLHNHINTELWPLLLTWFNFNPSMDK